MNNTGETNNAKASFLIAEYTALREEILKRTEIQHQLFSIAVVASGGFLSFMNHIPPKVFLTYPFLALFLSAAWAQSDIRINQIGKYIKKKLPDVAGWEDFFDKSSPSKPLGTLSHLTSGGILIGTQILAMVLFFSQRPDSSRFTSVEKALVAGSLIAVILTGLFIVCSDRWWRGRAR